jgi:hypothetical protein
MESDKDPRSASRYDDVFLVMGLPEIASGGDVCVLGILGTTVD